MTLRGFVLFWMGLVTAWAALPAWAQQATRLPTVGILSPGHQADKVCLPGIQGGGAACLLEALLALGYSDGRQVRFEYRFAEGAAERLPAPAAELVALRPDVIYTFTNGAADAAAKATSTIAVVVGPASERTMERLAGSLAPLVGNVTGLRLTSVEQEQKCLQRLKALAPRSLRAAVLRNPDNPNRGRYLDPTCRSSGRRSTRCR